MTAYQNMHIGTPYERLLRLIIFFKVYVPKRDIGESSLLSYGLNPFGIKEAHENIFLICIIQALVNEVT